MKIVSDPVDSNTDPVEESESLEIFGIFFGILLI